MQSLLPLSRRLFSGLGTGGGMGWNGEGAMDKKLCPICGYTDDGRAVYCRQCGAKMVTDGAGAAQGQGGQYSSWQNYHADGSWQQSVEYGPKKQTNGFHIASLVCGILSICACCCYGVPAIVLGIAGIVCANLGNRTGRSGVGKAGCICSIVGLVFGAIAVIYSAVAMHYMIQNGTWEAFLDMI